ncbi:uncharacterized protein LOC135484933 [Lineus longissimus]|uniref:uncharacterized protein LOC135484933 n=1 Tax=Lineus longissimus TaxID=88925 RepID=UPI00315CC1DF
MREFSLALPKLTEISDEALDERVKLLLADNHRIGANNMKVRLENSGIHVIRERVRKAMRRVDPAGVALRSRRAIKRRNYHVHGPNSLWHLDGNHKLIRWRFVTHGCVDGFSRLLTFVNVATNNRASTVLEPFRNAVQQFGLPSRIRIDCGGENTLVAEQMERERGMGRGSVIRGRSVHSTRIERIWLELWSNTINVFYDLFQEFEKDLILDPNCENQMFALHFVYLPRIRESVADFIGQWNHHKIRTENASPIQLFVQRSLELQGSTHTGIRDIFNRDIGQAEENPEDELNSDLSDESDGDAETRSRLTIVNVPDTVCPLTDEQLAELQAHVQPALGINLSDQAQGIKKYFLVLDFIAEKIAL